jgi:hypothetical protein
MYRCFRDEVSSDQNRLGESDKIASDENRLGYSDEGLAIRIAWNILPTGSQKNTSLPKNGKFRKFSKWSCGFP